MGSDGGRGTGGRAILLAWGLLLGWYGMAIAQVLVPASEEVGLVPRTGPLFVTLGYADCDKLHDGIGGWGINYYDDLDSNGSHDPGEPFADSPNPLWTNVRSASDSSCWLASACNMLEQLGVVPSASSLYMDYALNGIPSPIGTLTWDEGGLQEYFIQHWMNQHPAVDLTMTTHWCSSTVGYTDGMYAWEDWDPRAEVDNYLDNGWEVGIGIWPLGANGWHEGGHALTIQEVYDLATFDCTDSDRDSDWTGPGDLNTYDDGTRGPTPLGGHDYYAWYNDFYDGDINVYPVGDVGYVCAVVPEPATLSLLAAGMGAVWMRKRRVTE
jgi:hypothetical protein